MNLFATIMMIILGLLHIAIMCLEMFSKPETQANSFDMPLEFVKQPEAQTALKNQGIYNGVLGIVILLSLVMVNGAASIAVSELLAGFVLVVGIYGGLTATRKIFLIQALPGLIALLALIL